MCQDSEYIFCKSRAGVYYWGQAKNKRRIAIFRDMVREKLGNNGEGKDW